MLFLYICLFLLAPGLISSHDPLVNHGLFEDPFMPVADIPFENPILLAPAGPLENLGPPASIGPFVNPGLLVNHKQHKNHGQIALAGPLANQRRSAGENRWGQIGHYVTGEIAEYYLTDGSKEEVRRLLDGQSLALASIWMDEIRSDPLYDYTADWHWVTIPPGQTYQETEKNPDGDLIESLERKLAELKEGELSIDEEREKLKMVIHMIGDIHQPLHVGTGADQGGNAVRIQWMGRSSNLHRVWDSDIIESYQLSFTELADAVISRPSGEDVKEWQNTSVREWAMESVSYRDRVYDLPENSRLGYEYRYRNSAIIHKRLLQAGVRIAGVINDIYAAPPE